MASPNYNMTNLKTRTAVLTAVLLSTGMLSSPPVASKGIYQSGPDFIAKSFGNAAPELRSLWLTPEVKTAASKIVQHPIRGARVRYWWGNDRTVWILEEVGKELPITIGIVIAGQGVAAVKILTYRESRGGEVRFPAFLAQFSGGVLDTKNRLDHRIDGITGATLSVRAVKNTVRLALYYHRLVTGE